MKLKVTINSRSHIITEDRDLRRIVDALGNEFSRQVVFNESLLPEIIQLKKAGRLPLCNFYTKDGDNHKLLSGDDKLVPVNVKLSSPLELEVIEEFELFEKPIEFDTPKRITGFDPKPIYISPSQSNITNGLVEEPDIVLKQKRTRKKKGE